MPVTVKLSKLFQDRLGEEIADELVKWFNLVDATYRGELREINELNYARFEAKLEQRIAELRADLRERMAELRSELRAELTERLTKLREELSDSIRGTKVSLVRWMFAFWVGTALVILGSRLAQ